MTTLLPRSTTRRLPLIVLVAATALACGSTPQTQPTGSPIPTAASPTGSPPPALTPGTSPTPVPEGSSGPEEGIFRTQHGFPDGRALQIVLQDLTGLVTGITAREPGLQPFDEGVSNPPGHPNALIYTWVGGSCDTLTSITFERVADGFRLSATTKTTGDVCDLAGVFRGIEIALNAPVDADSVIVGNR
jgi:hypothetical protein